MSLNDPRWGSSQGGGEGDRGDGKRGDNNRGGNQGPPDLEEVWRDFNQRLAGLFGGALLGLSVAWIPL